MKAILSKICSVTREKVRSQYRSLGALILQMTLSDLKAGPQILWAVGQAFFNPFCEMLVLSLSMVFSLAVLLTFPVKLICKPMKSGMNSHQMSQIRDSICMFHTNCQGLISYCIFTDFNICICTAISNYSKMKVVFRKVDTFVFTPSINWIFFNIYKWILNLWNENVGKINQISVS